MQSNDTRSRLINLLKAVERDKRREDMAQFSGTRAEWQGATMTRDEILAARHEGHLR
ncbi:MAG: hypothetical protein OXE50_12635 [Chloroflexi bacterium]|nr:hypothetical protein [Chloroflexota bacterium]